MTSLEIVTVPCLSDNYAYLLRDAASGQVGLVDAPEAGPIEAELARRNWTLDLVLITHHHADHVQAVDALRGTA
jgi:hydroxyacylglutathione hydrolase